MTARADSEAKPTVRTEGLSSSDAADRLARFGPNELKKEQPRSKWHILFAQYTSPVILMLLAASGISAMAGEVADAIAISAILAINGLVGFFQEYRAERAMSALRSLTAPRARVVRDGEAQVIPAAHIVQGDQLLLEPGDVVAADAQILQADLLQANEATLTGESLPVEKSSVPADAGAALADRRNSVFMGTSITNGSGTARVTATGSATELGKIAHLLATAEGSVTPLQKRLEGVSRTLMLLSIAIVALVALIGLKHGLAWQEVLISAVSLAVAAVPEGLPAVVTIALALGVQRMAAQKVLVRRLHAIETIGCATVVCTDKTGTLTTGVMRVRETWGDEGAVLFAAAACCDAQLGNDGRDGVGDPTELALLSAARDRGIVRDAIERDNPKVGAIPFDPVRKRMAIRRANGMIYVKGALESVLLCSEVVPHGITETAVAMAQRGLRVLAIAQGTGVTEDRLTVLGLVGIADPPRMEAIEAVTAARAAGVRTVMITGDHPVTAAAIARELGIIGPGETAEGRVHARATPEEKLRIVRSWKAQGAVVAMTGDGVNDAPALREAHIGIAMGMTGTEVTREAADMILTDDNFASIIRALHEGRGIFDNIRKSITYLLAGNTAELAVMLIAALLGVPVPLLPLHILWINLATDGFPALALVTERTSSEVASRPPRDPSEPLLRRQEWMGVVAIGLVQAVTTLSVFVWALEARDLNEARNLAFTSLVFGELFRAFGARSTTKVLWEVGLFTNPGLLFIVIVSAMAQVAIHHVPVLQSMLQLAPLSLSDCVGVFIIGLVPLFAIEAWKLVTRRVRASRPS